MNERVTVLSHEQTIVILGCENIVESDHMFRYFLISLTEGKESMN